MRLRRVNAEVPEQKYQGGIALRRVDPTTLDWFSRDDLSAIAARQETPKQEEPGLVAKGLGAVTGGLWAAMNSVPGLPSLLSGQTTEEAFESGYKHGSEIPSMLGRGVSDTVKAVYDNGDMGSTQEELNAAYRAARDKKAATQKFVQDRENWPEGLAQGLTSLPYSGVTLAAAAPAAATGPLGPVVGGVAAGATAYRASKHDFMEDILVRATEELGRVPSPEEWKEVYDAYEGAAMKYGAWEAIPEAVSNVLLLKILGPISKRAAAALGAKLPEGLTKKLASGGVGRTGLSMLGTQAEEQVTEGLTSWGQGRVEHEAGLREKAPTIAEAYGESFAPTFWTTALTGGLGSAGTQLLERHKARKSVLGKPVQDGDSLLQAGIDAAEMSDIDAKIAALNKGYNPDGGQEASPAPLAGQAFSQEEIRSMMPDWGLHALENGPLPYSSPTVPEGASGLDLSIPGSSLISLPNGSGLTATQQAQQDHARREEEVRAKAELRDLEQAAMMASQEEFSPERPLGLDSSLAAPQMPQGVAEPFAPTEAQQPPARPYSVPDFGAGYSPTMRLEPVSGPVADAARLDQAANEAATSPVNDLPEPTEAQRKAGNYKKGHVFVNGLNISIENPAGSERSGVDENGNAWSTTMNNHYGYIKGTKGADKDHVDVFLGPNPKGAASVFVVDQVDPHSGRFDEHKAMVGFDSAEEAREAYLSNYEPGWNGLGAITEMPFARFKEWARSPKARKPLSPEIAAAVPSGAMTADQTRAEVESISSGWANAPQIKVVDTVADLPAPILRGVKKAGAENDTQGLFSDGTVYIVADRMTGPEHVKKTVLHEAVGHHGLRQIFDTEGLDKILDQSWLNKEVHTRAKEVAKLYGLNLKDRAQRREAVEEVLARMAENGEQNPMLGRMVAAVRRALRKIFPDLKLSNAEILEIVAKARRAVVEGDGRQDAEIAQTRMSRAAGEDDIARVLEMATMPRSAKTLAEARAIVRAFPDRDFVNSSTGLRATISLTNLTKMVSESAVRKSVSPAVHAQAVANVDVLFERALHEGAYPDRHNDPNIAAIHRFYAPMLSDGGLLQVKLTVKELKRADQGNRVYSVEAMEIQEPARNWKDSTVAEKLPTSFPHAGSFNQEIVTQWAQVNRRKDLRFSRNRLQPDNAETKSARQYRETERVYGGRAAYDKAKADGRTKLTYGQWVQVRTPNFKKWFGDWEAVATAKSIRDLAPVDATNAKEVVTKKDIENYFRNNGAATNALNGVTASFPVATAGKLYHHKGFPVGRIVGRLKEIFEQSVPFLSEKEVLKEGHKAHPNIDSFDHYVGKVSLGSGAESGEYYVRFTVRKEVAGKKGNIPRQETHNVAVSDVQIYEKPATTNLSGNTPEEGSHPAFVDSKLRDFFAKVNPSSVSKVVDPETGEPLVRDGQYENSRTGEKRDVGSFVPGAPTRFKRSAPAAKTAPKSAGKSGSFEHIFDRMRVLFQDQFLPVKRVQELLQSQGWKMDPDADAYLAEERYHGRAGYRLEKFQEDHVAPLMEKIRDSGTSILELEDYLYAKYAPQRNAHIASINPKMPDGGSGRTNKWAADTLARFQQEGKAAKLEALAKDVRAITKMQRDTIRKEGLEDDEVIDAWELANPDYVPLKGKADDQGHGRAIGTGFNVKGSGTKRALGRSTPATDILANLIAQTGDTLVRAEKARVGRAFYRMVEENPDADRWIIHEQLPSRRAMVNGQVRNVTDFSFPMEPNVITVTLPGGGVRYIELFDKDLAAAMKNVGAQQLHGWAVRTMAFATRYLATVSTSLSPKFVGDNFMRDIQMAMINIAGEKNTDVAKRVGKSVPGAMKGIVNYLRGDRKNEWAKWFELYKASGAQVSFMDLRGVDQIAKDLKLTALGTEGYMAKTRGQFLKVLNFIGDMNAAVENAVRLATFRVGIEHGGMSVYEAASMAKNLTVNFNRKGRLGPTVNAFYMFFNAGVQGTARVFTSLKNKRVRRMMGGLVLLSWGLAELNRLVAGDDDDGESKWDKHVTDFTKQTNLVIMTPSGEALKIKMPYGYNVFSSIGYALADIRAWASGKGGKNPAQAAGFVASTALNAFNPFGDDDLVQLASPTVLDPIVQLDRNKNFMGAKIYPEQAPYGPPRPDSQMYFRGVSKPSKVLADKLNTLTGGDKWEPGIIDISPESIDHMISSVTGGLGQFALNTASLPFAIAEGDVPVRSVPFLSSVWQEKNTRIDLDRFYGNAEKVDIAVARYKELPHQGKSYQEFLKKYPEARFGKAVTMARKRLSILRKELYAAQDAGDVKRAKEVDAKMREAAIRFNTMYNAAQKEAGRSAQ